MNHCSTSSGHEAAPTMSAIQHRCGVFIIGKKQFFQVSHEYASDTRSHFHSNGETLFLREISAIEKECSHVKHKLNELDKCRRGHSPVTALIEKTFTGLQGTIMRDRST